MNFYETLYIVHPALESGRLKDIIMAVEDSLKKMGGEPLGTELWGKKRLAYFIDKQKFGTYVLIQYNGKGKCTNDFSVALEHNPNILAYLTTNINQDDVIEQEEDLETQIAGKTREAERTNSRPEANDNQKSPTMPIIEKEGKSAEEINEEASASGGDKHVSSETENIKDDENKKGLSDKNEQVSVIDDLEIKDENNSAGENSTEETLEILNQEKEGKSSAKSEEE